MQRRRFVLEAAGLAASAAVGSSVVSSTDGAAQTANRPDILIFMLDDMRATDWQAMTRTKSLLRPQGTWFDNFFLTSPVCSPSRASVLTGMYAHNHGVSIGVNRAAVSEGRSWQSFEENDLSDDTIALALQKSGYHTGLVGKYFKGFQGSSPVPPGWDSWTSIEGQGYTGFTLNENGTEKTYRGKSYSTDVLRNAATDFVDAVPRDKPLFLYFTPTAPHTPLKPALRHRGDAAGAKADVLPDGTRKPWFNEADETLSSKPKYIRDRGPQDEDGLDRFEQLRLETLKSADEAFAAVLNRLQKRGRLNNAYVFVLTDNGFALGAHRWEEKAVPYDPVVRVPMLAAGPRFAGGGTDDRIVANIDIAPTIARLAGVAGRLRRADGRDLLSTSGAWRTDVYLAWGGPDNWRAVRTKDGSNDDLYVENGTGENEYYDYRSDPYELDNKLAVWKDDYLPEPAAEARAEELTERVKTLRECKGTSCP